MKKNIHWDTLIKPGFYTRFTVMTSPGLPEKFTSPLSLSEMFDDYVMPIIYHDGRQCVTYKRKRKHGCPKSSSHWRTIQLKQTNRFGMPKTRQVHRPGKCEFEPALEHEGRSCDIWDHYQTKTIFAKPKFVQALIAAAKRRGYSVAVSSIYDELIICTYPIGGSKPTMPGRDSDLFKDFGPWYLAKPEMI